MNLFKNALFKLRNSMLKNILIICLLFPLINGFCSQENSVLRAEDKLKAANHLLFFFDSGTVTMNQKQLDAQKNNHITVAGNVYRRILKNREKELNSNNYIDKFIVSGNEKSYVFEGGEIKKAAYDEIMLLGKDIQGLLIKSIQSQRDSIRLWILKCLINYRNVEVAQAFSNIIVEDKSSKREFSLLCKKLVASNLIHYIEFDVAKKLFKLCLEYKNPLVRGAALRSIIINDSNKLFIKQVLLEMYAREYAIIDARVKLYQVYSLSEVIAKEPLLITPFVNCIDTIYSHVPEAMSEIVVDEELLMQPSLKYVFIKHNHHLPQNARVKLLKHYIVHDNDVLTKIVALKTLKADDEKLFYKEVANIIENQKNITLINTSLFVAEKWKSKKLKSSIELLVKKIDNYRAETDNHSYREKVKAKALKVNSAI